MSGIDNADHGQVTIDGTTITALNERQRTLFRRDNIGIIFQFFNLIPTLTVIENITLPHELRGVSRRTSENLGRALLDRVGLGSRAGDFPDKLSGGEQQRVAIARALVHEPLLVLADEPTGNLDETTGESVLALLLELTRDAGKSLVIATHDTGMVPLADRVCRVHNGALLVESTTDRMVAS
jgi:putative ABC transport system ATP-binding protein